MSSLYVDYDRLDSYGIMVLLPVSRLHLDIYGTTSALPQWPKLYASMNLAQCNTFILPLH